MLVPRRMQGKKKVALITVIVLILIIIGYFIFKNLIANKETSRPVSLKFDISVTPNLEPGLNDDFLSKLPYNILKQSGQLPVNVEKMGRENPFAVILFSLPEE